MLRVLTLNLWGRQGPLGRRLGGLVDYLQRERPDVVGLQEVARHRGRSVAELLAARVGYGEAAHVDTGIFRSHIEGEGLAILTDLPVRGVAALPLPDAPRDHPRGLQRVDVTLPCGTPLRLANTHLSWRLRHSGHRTAQARAIGDALAGWEHPVVLTGDFNDVPGSPALRQLTGPGVGLLDSYGHLHQQDGATFCARNPYTTVGRTPQLLGRRVDHVLVRGLTPASAEIVLNGEDAPVVSDHYGVAVGFEQAA